MFYIYKITNIVNNKIYIGQTNNPSLRWHRHKSSARHNKNALLVTKAMIKYGINNFTFEVIATCKTLDDVNYLETEIIKQYNSRDTLIGYNISPGGNHEVQTIETRKRISDGLKAYYSVHQNKMKGKKLSKEWKQNIAKASLGKPGTNTGKKFPESWSYNIAKGNLGKPVKSTRRFTAKTEQRICYLYINEQMSTYALGIKFKCYRSLIRTILRRNNIIFRKNNYSGNSNGCNLFTKEEEQEICYYYLNNNISQIALSKRFKCGKTTIRDILLRN